MKGINHKYIILQRRKLKVFLNSGSEPWEAPIGHKRYQIDVWLESLFAALIFDYGHLNNTEEITTYLTDRYNKGVTPVHVQHFIEYFKASHKVEELDDCSLKDVFLLGDDIDGCAVPIYKYNCSITKEDEQMLLGKIQTNQDTSKQMLMDFFSMHMTRFNQSYYPKWGAGMEVKYLAENFLTMHGIRIIEKQNILRKRTWYDNFALPIFVIGYVIFFFVIPLIILNKIDFDNPFGWLMFFIFSFGIYGVMVFYKRMIYSK